MARIWERVPAYIGGEPIPFGITADAGFLTLKRATASHLTGARGLFRALGTDGGFVKESMGDRVGRIITPLPVYLRRSDSFTVGRSEKVLSSSNRAYEQVP